MEEKTLKISEVIENYAKKRDWLAIEFLLKVLHDDIPYYSPAYQLSKKEFEEKLRSVENTVEELRKGGESYDLHEVMEEIERIAGAQLREEIVRWLKQAPSHIINALFLIAELGKATEDYTLAIGVYATGHEFANYYLQWLYETSFGDFPYDTSEGMASSLAKYGMGFLEMASTKKHFSV
ncbi:MAG: hypothetical protein N3F63_07925, partial [Thermoplasmata archaeon]|nr:hypothetical protein [Thermoplasmata archaeon]